MAKLGIALLIVFIIIISLGIVRPTDQLTVRILDVGQGDSLYLRLPNQQDMLIDAGPDDRVLQQLGRYMPVGDRTLEYVVISHNHADHIGGLIAVLKQYQINQIWLSGAIHTTNEFRQLLEAIKAKHIPVVVVTSGHQATLGQMNLIILYPSDNWLGQLPEDQHQATIVIKAIYNKWCALFTGDLAVQQEEAVLARAQMLNISLNCPVLKVTHHGSTHGSSQNFLSAVQPKTALISVGLNNRYGHPTEALLTRLRATGAQIFRTDQQGTITVKTNGQNYSTITEK